MNKRIATGILAMITILSVMAGCTGDSAPSSQTSEDIAGSRGDGGGSGKVVEVRFAHSFVDSNNEKNPANEIVKQIIADFEAANPDIKIIQETAVGDEKRNKVRLDVTAGNECDVWHFWGGGVLLDYVNEGILPDIQDYLALSEKIRREDVPEEYWEFNNLGGACRAYPDNMALGTLMVNKEIFQEHGQSYPTTYEELLAVSQVFSEAGIASTNVGSKGGNPSHFWFSDLVCQYEGGPDSITDMFENWQFDNEYNRRAMQYCADMAAANVFPRDTMANGDWSPSFELFTQDKTAMCYTFTWMFAQLPRDMLDKVEIIPFPAMPDGEVNTQTYSQGWVNDSYVITQKALDDSERAEACVKVMDMLCYDISMALGQAGTLVPTNDRILEQIDYNDPSMGLLGMVMQYRMENGVTGRPNHWANCPTGELQFYYQSTLDEVWAGSITADEAIDKIQKKFEEEKANA